MKITEKQKRFADYYIKHLNATKSAKLAGYSEKTAYSIGSELLKKPEVQEYIQAQKDLIMDHNILDTKEILYLLSRIAKGEQLEQKEVILKRAEFMTNPSTDRQNLVYNEILEFIEVEPKTSDKNKALELLGKVNALFTDKQEVITTNTSPVLVSGELYNSNKEMFDREFKDRTIIIDDLKD